MPKADIKSQRCSRLVKLDTIYSFLLHFTQIFFFLFLFFFFCGIYVYACGSALLYHVLETGACLSGASAPNRPCAATEWLRFDEDTAAAAPPPSAAVPHVGRLVKVCWRGDCIATHVFCTCRTFLYVSVIEIVLTASCAKFLLSFAACLF